MDCRSAAGELRLWGTLCRALDPAKLTVAGCCVQASKVYVQDRIREASDSVWDLLCRGAHVYVCGDAASMAGTSPAHKLIVACQHLQVLDPAA